MRNLDKIDIISGSTKLDNLRINTALGYIKKENLFDISVRFLGAGPDWDKADFLYGQLNRKEISKEEYKEELAKLDHHLEGCNLLRQNHERVKLVTKPVTLAQDVFYGFRSLENEFHGIVTEPWHYKKFDYSQRRLKEKGILSDTLEFINLPSSETESYPDFKKFFSWIKTIYEIETMKKD